MKKMSKIIVALLCISALGLAIAGCSCTTDNSKSNSTDNKTTTTTTDNSTRSGSDANKSADTKSNGVVGSWKYTDKDIPELTATYTFKEDGTGSYDLAGQVMNLTYKVDGNKLSITFEGQNTPMEVEFTVTADTLTIKDATGVDVVYKKV